MLMFYPKNELCRRVDMESIQYIIYTKLNDVWESVPTKSYSSDDIEMPEFMFIVSIAFLIPLPLAIFYTEAYSFLLGCMFIPAWVSILGARIMLVKMMPNDIAESSESVRYTASKNQDD